MVGRYKNSPIARSALVIGVLTLVTLAVAGGNANADILKSPDYQLQPTVGNSFGGSVGSTNYSLTDSGGEAAIGNGAGGSYKIGAGFVAELTHSINLYVEPAGLVGYWPMNEGAGDTVHDASGNSNDGTTSGSPTWVQGRINGALNFNGTSQYVAAGNSPISGTQSFTLSAWIDTTQVSGYSGALAIGPSGTNEAAYIGTVGTAQVGASNSIGGGFYGNNFGSGVTTTNQWVYVVMTFSGGSNGTAIIYVNGVPKVSTSATPNLSAGPLQIGKIGSDTTYDFSGSIDDVKVFNRALSSDEVYANYQAGLAGLNSGLVIPAVRSGQSQTVGADVIVSADAPYSLLMRETGLLTNVDNSSITIPSIVASIASPAPWVEGTTQGLGFTVTSGPSASPPDPKWGSGVNYAAVPSSSTSYYNRAGFSGGAKDVIGLQYRLDVSGVQAAGQYQNDIVYTATITP